MVLVECEYCKTPFEAREADRKRGRARFCTQRCSSSRPKNKEHNVRCHWCGVSFYKSESNIAGSKSGLFFCSRAHKDRAQRIGGVREIMPSHYGTAGVDYRAIAFESHPPCCNVCGYLKHKEILHVHHRDHDKSNNSPSNLELLCPTCHMEHHFETRSGPWKRNGT